MNVENTKLRFMVEIAIFSGLAFVLDFFSLRLWYNGGSISFSMIPVFIVAYRWGIKGGVISGLIFGLLQAMISLHAYTPVQALLDYVVAFGLIGFAGIVAGPLKNAIKKDQKIGMVVYVVIGAFIGSLLRFLAHFTAGIVFWAEYAPEGQPAWLYSIIYNGSYMLPSFIISAAIIGILFSVQSKFIRYGRTVEQS